MSTARPTTSPVLEDDDALPLRMGMRMDQRTFHALYEQMPEGFKAELIGGVVYVPSPAKTRHGRKYRLVITWMGNYSDATPGTDCLADTTTILAEDSEPQPDCGLLIIGGRAQEDEDEYLTGPPELLAEVADSSVRFNLGAKKDDYERLGVQEYVVVVIPQQRVVWFVRENDRFVELQPDADGIYRSPAFPGLWLDAAALLKNDGRRVQEVLQQGLASSEHAAFVERLAERSSEG